MNIYPLIRPLLFTLDAERTHDFSLLSLRLAERSGLLRLFLENSAASHPPKQVMGLSFPTPIGLAAGLDKNGMVIDAMSALGFGFIEVGTVTPRPQPGNPKPRLFRLSEAQGIINRFGFNNQGVDQLLHNLKSTRYQGILGINIGKNFDTPNESAVDDYLICMRKVYQQASYIAVNISSPNTKNLRDLQEKNALTHLLTQLKLAQQQLAQTHGRYVPLALKIAPDLTEAQVIEIAHLLMRHQIDGVIATNTTLSRESVQGLKNAAQTGGLSGAPVKQASTRVIKQLATQLQGALPIIGVGGILTGEDAIEKIQAGASLVQLYSGLIYRGHELIKEVRQALT